MHTLESSCTHTNTGSSELCTFAFPFLSFCEQLGHDFKLLYLTVKKIKLKKRKKQDTDIQKDRRTERKV